MTVISHAPESLPVAAPSRGFPVKWLAVLIALIALLAFSPIVANNFILVDDQATVQNNPDFNPKTQDLGISHEPANDRTPQAAWTHYWTGPTGEHYIPITYTLWGLVSFIAKTTDPETGAYTGLSPALYHALSLLLHALNSILVLLVLNKLIARVWPAFFGAALFAVHPLQTEAVAWISQTSILLGSFFSLLAILQFMIFTDRCHGPAGKVQSKVAAIANTPVGRGGGWMHYVLGSLALGLALLSHPSAVVTPALVLIIELFRRRGWKTLLAPLAVWVLMCVPIIVLTQHWQSAAYTVALQDRPRIVGDAFAFYLYKLFLPIGLLPDYGHTPAWFLARQGMLAWTWTAPIALALVSAIFWKKARWPAAASLLFAVALLPGLGLGFLGSERFSTTSDQFMYLPMLGAALALACAIAREAKPMTFIAAGLLLAFLAGLSVRQAAFWSDTLRLYTRVIDLHPDNRDAQELVARAYDARAKDDVLANNMPQVRIDEGAARDHFLIAGGLPGDDGISFYNAAWCDVHLQQYETALRDANAALNDPKFPLRSATYLMKGTIHEKLKQLDAAAENYNKAIATSKQPGEREAAIAAQNGLTMRQLVESRATTQPVRGKEGTKK